VGMGQTSFLTWGTMSTLLQAICFLFRNVRNPRSSGFQGSHGRGSTLPNEGGVPRIGGVRIRVGCRAQFRRQTPIASYWKTPRQGIHWYPRRTRRGPHEGIYAATRWVPCTYLGRFNILPAVGAIQRVSLRNLPARSRYKGCFR
jgi:hypothetical protein